MKKPGMIKKANHPIFKDGKKLFISFCCNSVHTEVCAKGLCIVIFTISKLYEYLFP